LEIGQYRKSGIKFEAKSKPEPHSRLKLAGFSLKLGSGLASNSVRDFQNKTGFCQLFLVLFSFALIFNKVFQNFASTKLILKIELNSVSPKRKVTKTCKTIKTDRKFQLHCLIGYCTARVGNSFGFACHIRDNLGIRGPVNVQVN